MDKKGIIGLCSCTAMVIILDGDSLSLKSPFPQREKFKGVIHPIITQKN
jgi:hypothetical protein